MQLGQFSASITVDDVPLPEYAVEYAADGMEATCWIPSETDKEFSIDLRDADASPRRIVSGRVAVDGMRCGGMHLSDPSRTGVSTASRNSVSTSDTTRRPLKFAKQVLTDDDTYLNVAISPDLGTIKAVFALVRPRAGSLKKPRHYDEPANILHERSKKALGHSVQLGPEYHRNSHTTSLPSQTIETLATLTFKYRPIELLRAQGIAPPLVRDVGATIPTDILDLTTDVDSEGDDEDTEIKKLQARLEALQKNKKRKQVKRESPDVKKEIKREDLIFKPGEVIDLT
ncbi:hypothetical protein DFH06DRAFT_507865 [Mycena polygramma]|nr:hypothetical protein DFH06DRAFT_507865 [Mycena polygramma]